MTPAEVGRSYDAITGLWAPGRALGGVAAHRRAMGFAAGRGAALDVGCGCNGRIIDLLREAGFAAEGVDVSQRMVELARERHPGVPIHHADICGWALPRRYDFITGWDSIWHVPLAEQAGVLRKLCDGLNPGGVLIFTMGGTDGPGEVRDAHMGVPMYTATLGIPQTLAVLDACGCVCRHLEYDQPPEKHVVVIASRS